MPIQQNQPISNTFGLQVFATYFLCLEKLEELNLILAWQEKHPNLPVLVIGEGSNVLFLDEEYEGLLVLNRLK